MSFSTITAAEIVVGKPITAQLMAKIKGNFDELDIRLGAGETVEVTANNTIDIRSTSLIQLGDTTAGNIVSTLPAATLMEGIILVFKKTSVDTNTFSVSASGAELIDGSASYTISEQYDTLTVTSDSTNWYILNKIDTANLVTSSRVIGTTSPLTGGGNLSADRTIALATGGITNTYVSASAAIAYSKLALTSSILNADISSTAAIAYSKLNLTGVIVNADVSASAAIAYSKLNLTGLLVNADFSTSAAISTSKLAALTVSRALQTNSSTGLIEVSTVTSTELGYMSTVSSNVQTQLNNRMISYTGDIATSYNHTTWYGGASTAIYAGTTGIYGGLLIVSLKVNATTSSTATFVLYISKTTASYDIGLSSFAGNTTYFGASGASVTWSIDASANVTYNIGVGSPAGFTSTDVYVRALGVS